MFQRIKRAPRFRLQSVIFLLILLGAILFTQSMPTEAKQLEIIPQPSLQKLQPGDEIVSMRTRTSKTYWLSDNKYAIDVSVGSIHYQNNQGKWVNIKPSILPSNRPNWNWEVTKGHWALLIKDDTTVAVGKDGHWIGFRYDGLAYLDWSTKSYVILDTKRNVTPIVSGNKIRWEGLFYGCNLEYVYGNDRFKENLEVTEQARDWLEAHPPSSFGLNNATTFIGGYLECDWKNAYPAEDQYGNPINWGGSFDRETLETFFRHPVRDYLVSALPLGYAYHNQVDPQDLVKLKQRFWFQNNKNYLLFGAKVLDLKNYPSGTITLDPTVDEQVGSSADDGNYIPWAFYADGTDLTVGNQLYETTDITHQSFYRFSDVLLPTDITFDIAYLSLYIFYSAGSAETKIYADDQESPSAPTSVDDASGRSRTTNGVELDGPIDTGDWLNTSSIIPIIEELYDSYDYSSGNPILFLHDDDSSPTGSENRIGFYSYDYSDNTYGPKLHIEYSTPPSEEFTALSLSAILDTQINASWDAVDNATGYLLLVSMEDYPSNPQGDDVIAYSGNFTVTSVNLTGYNLLLTTYYFSLWAEINSYSEQYATASIGGESMADLATNIAEGLSSLSSNLQSIFLLLPLAFFIVLAFWRQDMILFIISGIITIIIGLQWIEDYPGVSVMLWGLGIYQLYKAVTFALQAGGPSRGLSQFKAIYHKVRGK